MTVLAQIRAMRGSYANAPVAILRRRTSDCCRHFGCAIRTEPSARHARKSAISELIWTPLVCALVPQNWIISG